MTGIKFLKSVWESFQFILEVKSSPNIGEPSKDAEDKEIKPIIYNLLAPKHSNKLHPKLYGHSITESLSSLTTNRQGFLSSKMCRLTFLLIAVGFLALVAVHPCVPLIYRRLNNTNNSRSSSSNESSIVITWHVNFVRYSYIVFSSIFYTYFVCMMIISILSYLDLLYDLKRLLLSTDLMQQVDLEAPYYLNLRRLENFEYFLHLFPTAVQRIDPNHVFITTMAFALFIEIVLIVIAVIRVFVLGHSTDLLTVWCLIDIFILSFFIMIFVIVVVFINKSTVYDFIRRLRNLKKEMVTSAIVHGGPNTSADYLDVIIEHMEGVKEEYAVRLLGFIVDHALALKILISIITGLVSAITSLVRN